MPAREQAVEQAFRDKFHAYLTELCQNYGRLSALLARKLAALGSFDLQTLDSIIKEEQAYAMISRGFDTNIRSHREKLGLHGQTLDEIIVELPEDERQRFRDVSKNLRSALNEAKTLNEKCQSLIEERLYSLDKAIKELDHSQGTAYTKGGGSGQTPDDPPRMFTKSV